MTNELIALIKTRRSIREFKPDVPTDADILQIIDAARYAPSATNLQPWRFLVVKDHETKDMMVSAVEAKLESLASDERCARGQLGRSFAVYCTLFKNAPVVIVVLYKSYPTSVYRMVSGGAPGSGDEAESDGFFHPRSLGIQSASAAVQNMLLAAHAIGLGACWMDAPLIADKELKEILCVRVPWQLLAVVPIGLPVSIPDPPRRKRLETIVTFVSQRSAPIVEEEKRSAHGK